MFVGVECVRPVCAVGDRDLICVHKMGEYAYLMRCWEMDDDPTVAPRCEIRARELFDPVCWSDPLSNGGCGAPGKLLDAHPSLQSD